MLGIQWEELLDGGNPAASPAAMQSAKPLNGGELRDLNRRYKAYRLARVAAGERAQPYGAWPARSSRWSAAPRESLRGHGRACRRLRRRQKARDEGGHWSHVRAVRPR